MVADKKIAWPAQLAMGGDGLGNSLDHIREIMGTSMESLIHHFKLVTEGFRVLLDKFMQPSNHLAANSVHILFLMAEHVLIACTSANHHLITCNQHLQCVKAAWLPTSSALLLLSIQLWEVLIANVF